MEKINIAWELIGQFAVGVGVMVGLVQGLKYLRSQTSIAKLEDKVQQNTTNLEKDLKHLERLDIRMDGFEKQLIQQETRFEKELEKINENLNIFGGSMASIMNHMIDGKTENLKEERDKLVNYLIKRD